MENFQTAQDYVFSPPASLATSDTEMEDQDQISIRGYGLQRIRRQYLNVQANAPSKPKELMSSSEFGDYSYDLLHQIRPPSHAKSDRFTPLPTELITQVFSYLNVADSVCLGLTQPSFYKIHFYIHGSVTSLYYLTSRPVVCKYSDGSIERVKRAGFPLHWKLRGFMKKLGYFYCYEARKFVQYGKGWMREGCICEKVAKERRGYKPK